MVQYISIILKMSNTQIADDFTSDRDDWYDGYNGFDENDNAYDENFKLKSWHIWYSLLSWFSWFDWNGMFDEDDGSGGYDEDEKDEFRKNGWEGPLPPRQRGPSAKYAQFCFWNGDVTDKISPVGLPKSRPHKNADKSRKTLVQQEKNLRIAPDEAVIKRNARREQKITQNKTRVARENERKESRKNKSCCEPASRE